MKRLMVVVGVVAVAAILAGALGRGGVTGRPTVPDDCVEALELADQALDAASRGFGLVAQTTTALSQLDLARATALTKRLHQLTEEVGPTMDRYRAAKAACLAAA